MRRQNTKLFALILLFTTQAFSAVSARDSQIMEELTGKQNISAPSKKNQPKNLAALHLAAGNAAFKNKNYILALKHYNTVIVKFPRSAEVKKTYLAKGQLYTQMGLYEPAKRNTQLAFESSNITK